MNHIAAAGLGFRGDPFEGMDGGRHHDGQRGGTAAGPLALAPPAQDVTTNISLPALFDQPKTYMNRVKGTMNTKASMHADSVAV